MPSSGKCASQPFATISTCEMLYLRSRDRSLANSASLTNTPGAICVIFFLEEASLFFVGGSRMHFVMGILAIAHWMVGPTGKRPPLGGGTTSSVIGCQRVASVEPTPTAAQGFVRKLMHLLES